MVTSAVFARTWQPQVECPPLVLGHRGASARATENTVEAFARAMADGADGVELDVQCCSSGEVVVYHDQDLSRLAGRPDRIEELPWDELRTVRLIPGGGIATLGEAFEACGPSALVNVELKYEGLGPHGVAGLVAGVARAVSLAGAARRVLVSSFSPAALWVWRRQNPSIPCALLFECPKPFHRPWPLRTDLLAPLLCPFALHPAQDLCSPRTIQAWRRRGYCVNTWTVDQPERIRELANMGVHGIITNDPAGARVALGAS